jgi:uncharacterized protein
MTFQAVDHAGMAVLPYEECLRLLDTTPVGRVAFATGGEIVILPVNYVLDASTVVFRSDSGAKLTAAQEAKEVGFEIDGWDAGLGEGWSVILHGRAAAVYDEATIERLSLLGLHQWGPDPARRTWVAIHPNSVSGRRVAPG